MRAYCTDRSGGTTSSHDDVGNSSRRRSTHGGGNPPRSTDMSTLRHNSLRHSSLRHSAGRRSHAGHRHSDDHKRNHSAGHGHMRARRSKRIDGRHREQRASPDREPHLRRIHDETRVRWGEIHVHEQRVPRIHVTHAGGSPRLPERPASIEPRRPRRARSKDEERGMSYDLPFFWRVSGKPLPSRRAGHAVV
jgi:hypothetical protein